MTNQKKVGKEGIVIEYCEKNAEDSMNSDLIDMT